MSLPSVILGLSYDINNATCFLERVVLFFNVNKRGTTAHKWLTS